MAEVMHGDCLEIMRGMDASSVDAIVTDPPYHLTSIVERFGKENAAPTKSDGATGVYARASRGFMGQTWDGGDIAFRPELWREALRVLKPGGYILAFGGTRTYHRMTVAIEDAGFEIRDCIGWHYGSGFPKSLSVEKQLPQEHAKAWAGWGTALKPAWEPVVVARKPLEGTVAANVLKHGTGAMNIDASRVEGARWPANILLTHAPDCSDEGCAPGCPCAAMDAQSGVTRSRASGYNFDASGNDNPSRITHNIKSGVHFDDQGGASRFFNQLAIEADDLVPFIYAAKASRREREAGCSELPERSGAEAVEREADSAGLNSPRAGAGRTSSGVRNHHPTVKPISVMEWCIRLVTREGALVLDPFCGSGTTGAAAVRLGRRFIGCEQSAEYVEIARARIAHHGHQLKLG